MRLKSFSQKDRYGNMTSFEFFEPDDSIPMILAIPEPDGYNGADSSNHPGEPRGTDTVPAWLTPGENVVNAEASRIPGNQEKIDEMNEQGRQIQAAQGGPIPTYAAEGRKIEERKMKDGRIGLFQGNTFLGIAKESSSPLSKISDAAKELDWNPFNSQGGSVPPMYAADGIQITDELLDAIRQVESGGDDRAVSRVGAAGPYQIMADTALQPGYGVDPISLEDRFNPNKSREFTRQYLEGIAKANPDFTQDQLVTAYHSGPGNVAKGNIGPQGQSYFGKVMSALNPISTAEAATNAPVPTVNTQAPPVIEDFSDVEDISLPDVNVYDTGVALEAAKSRQASLKEKVQSAKARGVDNPDLITELEQANSEVVATTQANQKALVEKETADKLAAKERADTIARADAAMAGTSAPPKPQEKVKKSSLAELAKANLDKKGQTKQENDGQSELTITQTGEAEVTEDPTLAKQIAEGFTDFFGDLFDPKEIARMTMLYAGSRALGYEHGDSLSYAAKQYMQRYDAETTARKKFATDKDTIDTYTASSIQDYLDTGDMSKLIAKQTSGGSITGQSGTRFDTYTGTEVPVYKVGTGENAFLAVQDEDGNLRNLNDTAVRGRYEVINANVHDSTKVRDAFQKSLANQVSEINRTISDDEQKLDFSTEQLASEAELLYTNTRNNFRMKAGNARVLSREIIGAQKDFLEDMKRHQQNPTEVRKPTSIEGYYNKRTVTLKTGGVVSQNDIKETTAENFKAVDDSMMALAANQAGQNASQVAPLYREMWKTAKDNWRNMKSYGSFTKGTDPGYDPFIAWTQAMLVNDPKALELLEASNMKTKLDD